MRRASLRRFLLMIGAVVVLGAGLLPLHAAGPAKESAAPLHVTYYYLPG